MKRLFLLLLPLLGACASTPDLVSRLNPFKIDVRQGNYVTQEMVVQLKPGQTKDQVRFILGSPLVTDVFHAERWDYIYRLAKGNGEVQQRHLAVFFEDGKLVRVAGDVVARSGDGADAAPQPAAKVIEIAGPVSEKKAAEDKSKAEGKLKAEEGKPVAPAAGAVATPVANPAADK